MIGTPLLPIPDEIRKSCELGGWNGYQIYVIWAQMLTWMRNEPFMRPAHIPKQPAETLQ